MKYKFEVDLPYIACAYDYHSFEQSCMVVNSFLNLKPKNGVKWKEISKSDDYLHLKNDHPFRTARGTYYAVIYFGKEPTVDIIQALWEPDK